MSDNTLPILGYYGHNNAGDEAFKIVFAQTFSQTSYQFVSHLQEFPHARTVVVGGGAVINDYFLRHVQGVPNIHFLGCSLPHGPGDIECLRRLPGQVRQLMFRSRADVEELRNAGFSAEFSPDIVFAMSPEPGFTVDDLIAAAALPPVNFSPDRKKLFVFLSDDYSVPYSEENAKTFFRNETFAAELAAALDTLAEKFDIIMPSMSVWYSARDYLFAATVVRRMKRRHRVCIVERYIEPERLLGAISSCDSAVMSMKFHGLIFGLSAGRFVINIGGTRKNRDLMKDADLAGLSCPIAEVTRDRIIGLMSKHREERLTDKISALAAAWRAEARDNLSRAASRVSADIQSAAA